MRGAADWFGRLTLLILAGLATLSLMSSLASISGGPMGGLVSGRGDAVRDGRQVTDAVPSRTTETDDDPLLGTITNDAGIAVERVPAPTPPVDREILRWLQALTYAVLALAGFAAAGLVVLLRITAHLARIAGR